jgi:hypothetical protein
MDKQLEKEIGEKAGAARAVMILFFNEDGTEQSLISGKTHDLIATLASQMNKVPNLRLIVESAVTMAKNAREQ